MRGKNKIITVLFFMAMVFVLVINIVVPDKAFSNEENRSLQQAPEFSLESFLNGNFQEDYEVYRSDQFVGRNVLKKTKTTVDKRLGIKKVDDVYIGRDGMLFQEYTSPDKDALNDTITSLNHLYEKYSHLSYTSIIVPNKIAIYEDLLPGSLPKTNQLDDISRLYKGLDHFQNIDMSAIFKKNKDKYLYYDTDHHWTINGAELTFQQWLKVNKYDNLEKYSRYVSNDDFVGTLAHKVGTYDHSDTIYIDIPKKSDVKYLVSDVENDESKTSVFDSSKQLSNDPYAVFMGGNKPRIDISTNVETTKHLLIFKDSYANCFIPYLLPYYNEIVVIDPRYYGEDIDQVITDEKITDVMFLYNANTFFSDSSLTQLLNN